MKALPPGVCEIQVFGSCHERAPGLEKGDQPSSIAAVARLDLPYAYTSVTRCQGRGRWTRRRPSFEMRSDSSPLMPRPTYSSVTYWRSRVRPAMQSPVFVRRLGSIPPTRAPTVTLATHCQDRES